jgi:hypothetical protein
MPFVSSTLKRFEKWRSPLSGATGNFNHQILPYGILILTFISGNNISALISCNFIIKNYVNRKITSYIYILIFTISLWLHVKHFITLKHEKGKCEKIFFCNYRSGLSLSTHRIWNFPS